jgi:hypothetical protein
MMDEDRLTNLLVAASDEIAARRFDPEDDLRRGRTARRRRRTAGTAAAVLGTAAAVVVALALSGQLGGRPELSVTPAGSGPAVSTTVATVSAPPTPTTSTTVATTATPTSVTSTATPELFGVPPGARDFLRLVFGVAQDHMDPAHERLQWTEGFTGGGGLNTREWGQKFGWQAANDPGQAMVYAAVGDKAAVDRLGCGQYDYRGSVKCTAATMSNGQKAQVLNTSTRREVHWNRPDGTYVFVIADAVFGNNTAVASKSILPTLAQLEDFVMDPRLVLPPA